MPALSTTLITGASSGLGAALAHEYAAPGMRLLLTGRNLARLEEVAVSCRNKGAIVETVCLDVCDSKALAGWIEKMDNHTPIDRVIANAGISGGTADGLESDAQTRAIIATNLDGVLNTLLPLVPRMQQRQSGHIVIISSLAGYRGLPSSPAYSASKAAVRIYGEALRGLLMKDQVQVTVVTPGYITTPMTDVNDFPMPFIMPAEKAARLIRQRLEKYPARIAFPFPLYALIWLLSCLPPGLTDPLFARLPGKKNG